MLKLAYQLGVALAVKEAGAKHIPNIIRQYPHLAGAIGGGLLGTGISALVPDANYKTMLAGGLGGAGLGALGVHGYKWHQGRKFDKLLDDLEKLVEDIPA